MKLGPYEIIELLGSGGMGEVYRAKDSRLNREVAVKILSESWRQDPGFLIRFEREAKVLASLNHPNIVSLHEFGEVDGRAYAVMELLQGQTLRQALADGPLPLRQAAEIGAEVAHGLAAAHREGVIHRDLKPENIFLTDQGPVKLLDFGLAKKIVKRVNDSGEEEAELHPTSTNAGVLLGTVGYMAPEQLQADGHVDGRSDLFALGCVLYETVAGIKAFASETPMGTLHLILTQDPDFELPTFPAGLRDILRHCLAKVPDHRFQDAQDLAYALESFRHPTSGAVPAQPLPERRAHWPWALAAGILILLVGGAFLRWRARPKLAVFMPLSPREGQVHAARFDGSGNAVFALRERDAAPIVLERRPDGSSAEIQARKGLVPVCRTPDGSWLFLRGTRRLVDGRERVEGDLLRGELQGGRLESLSDGVTDADASQDGWIAAIRRVDGRERLEAPLGVMKVETNGWMDSLRVDPSGRWIAFVDHPASSPGGTLSLLNRKDGSVRNLLGSWRSIHGLAWTPGGEIWFTGSRNGEPQGLYATNPDGHLRPLLSGPENLVIEDISPEGQSLLLEERDRSGILARGPTGDPGPVESENPELLGFSWDGRWLAFATGSEGVDPEIRLARLGLPAQLPDPASRG